MAILHNLCDTTNTCKHNAKSDCVNQSWHATDFDLRPRHACIKFWTSPMQCPAIVWYTQRRRMPCKSEGAQASGMRTISHLGGSGGMLPQENLEFLTSRESLCFWGLLTVVLRLFKSVYIWKIKGLSPSTFQSGGGGSSPPAPLPPLFSLPMIHACI